MNSEWQTFLEEKGGVISSSGVVDFTATEKHFPKSEEVNALMDLSHIGLIRVTGDDRLDFLQGQLTNDITLLGDNRSQISGYLTPKGRMLADFRLFPGEDAIYISINRALLEPTMKRLKMFVMRSKVVLENASQDFAHAGISGEQAQAILEESSHCALPTEVNGVTHHAGITILRIPGAGLRYEFFGSVEKIKPIWEKMTACCTPAPASLWDWQEIHAGLPHIFESTVETFVPQMVNLDLIDGVNFKKGCYTGQEVVARMHYLGKSKRRMFLAQVEVQTGAQPQPGDSLYSAASTSSQGAGTVVNSVPINGNLYELLVVAEIVVAKANQLHLVAADGPMLTIQALPYSIEDKES